MRTYLTTEIFGTRHSILNTIRATMTGNDHNGIFKIKSGNKGEKIGRYRSSTEAAEAAINLLFRQISAEETRASAAGVAEELRNIDLFRLQSIASDQLVSEEQEEEEERKATGTKN